jgi:hypothetical protein
MGATPLFRTPFLASDWLRFLLGTTLRKIALESINRLRRVYWAKSNRESHILKRVKLGGNLGKTCLELAQVRRESRSPAQRQLCLVGSWAANPRGFAEVELSET